MKDREEKSLKEDLKDGSSVFKTKDSFLKEDVDVGRRDNALMTEIGDVREMILDNVSGSLCRGLSRRDRMGTQEGGRELDLV